MYYELMASAGKDGFRLFDFGRSKIDTGSFDFKAVGEWKHASFLTKCSWSNAKNCLTSPPKTPAFNSRSLRGSIYRFHSLASSGRP